MKSIFVSCLAVAVLVGVSGCEKPQRVLADWEVHEESKRCEFTTCSVNQKLSLSSQLTNSRLVRVWHQTPRA
jgi:hypothetical protein